MNAFGLLAIWSGYLFVMMSLGIQIIGLILFLFHSDEIYFSPLLDLKRKLDGYCVSGNKNGMEVYLISYRLPCQLVILITTAVIANFDLHNIFYDIQYLCSIINLLFLTNVMLLGQFNGISWVSVLFTQSFMIF